MIRYLLALVCAAMVFLGTHVGLASSPDHDKIFAWVVWPVAGINDEKEVPYTLLGDPVITGPDGMQGEYATTRKRVCGDRKNCSLEAVAVERGQTACLGGAVYKAARDGKSFDFYSAHDGRGATEADAKKAVDADVAYWINRWATETMPHGSPRKTFNATFIRWMYMTCKKP